MSTRRRLWQVEHVLGQVIAALIGDVHSAHDVHCSPEAAAEDAREAAFGPHCLERVNKAAISELV